MRMALIARTETVVAEWDSTITVSPDPSWPAEKQLRWYKICSHMLLLNCSEIVRARAAQQADREVA